MKTIKKMCKNVFGDMLPFTLVFFTQLIVLILQFFQADVNEKDHIFLFLCILIGIYIGSLWFFSTSKDGEEVDKK